MTETVRRESHSAGVFVACPPSHRGIWQFKRDERRDGVRTTVWRDGVVQRRHDVPPLIMELLAAAEAELGESGDADL